MRRKKAETQPPPAQPLGVKKVRRTEEFMEAVKEEQAAPPAITIPAEVIEDDEPVDRFEEFFARVRDQQGWTLLIYRLNSFDKDGKTDLRGNNTYMGRITFDPDTYLDDVQAMCPEGGAFKLQAKTPDNRYSEQWVEKVAPLKLNKPGGSTHYIIQPNGSSAPETPQKDTLEQFIEFGEKAGKLRKVLGWDNEPPQVQAVPVQATVEREPLQDRIIGAALESVFKSGKPETAEEILRAYIAPQREESWTELIKELVKPLAPVVMGLLSAYMQNQARAAQAQQASIQQAPQAQLPPSAMTQTNPGEQPTWATPTPFSGQQPAIASQWPALEIPQNAEPYDTFQQGIGQTPPQPESRNQAVIANAYDATRDDDPLSPEEEEEMGRDDLILTLGEMLEQCVRKAVSDPIVIEQGRQEVANYKARFPLMTGLIDALATLPPEAIIGMLASKVPEVAVMINNDVAKETIRDFQAALRRPEVIQ